MRSIGISVALQNIYYVITENDIITKKFSIFGCGNICVPKTLKISERLSFIRNTMITIIDNYKIYSVGIRTIEASTVGSVFLERIYIEGVLQELISNCTVTRFFAGDKLKIANILKIEVQVLSDIFNGYSNYFSLEEWDKTPLEVRECICCAIATSYL